ncbi:methyl-accepting chemotaxis protein [Clostridium sp. JNZ X4-2]
MKSLTIKSKINLLVITIMLILSTAILILVYYNLSKMTINSYSSQLKSNSAMALKLLNEKYSGSWQNKNGKLYKGNKLISGNTAFVDEINKETGDHVTIFLNDTRVSTTIVKDGKRAVNTKASAQVSNKVLELGQNYQGEAEILNEPYEVIYNPIKNSSGNNIGMFFIGVNKSVLKSQIYNTFVGIGIIVVLILALAIVAVNIFITRIIRVMLYSSKHISLMAEGDFTKNVPDKYLNYKDEGGLLVKGISNMQKSLNNLLFEIKNKFNLITGEYDNLVLTSKELMDSSGNVSDTISQVASANTSQAQQLIGVNEVLDSFSNELAAIIKEINNIDKSSNKINIMAQENSRQLPKTIKSIETISSSFKEFQNSITEFSSNVVKINDITDIIDNVSDQTNLLALNAAIEAARAGEAGKGFAVVADEVRKLASQTKDSSTEINRLVKLVSEKIGDIVKQSSLLEEKISSQTQSINISLEAFSNIADAVENMVPKIKNMNVSIDNLEKNKNKIVSTSEENSATAEEISASTEEISASSTEMSKSADEVYNSIENLRNMVEELKKSIEKFKIAGGRAI